MYWSMEVGESMTIISLPSLALSLEAKSFEANVELFVLYAHHSNG